jgi:hypothetical protein
MYKNVQQGEWSLLGESAFHLAGGLSITIPINAQKTVIHVQG